MATIPEFVHSDTGAVLDPLSAASVLVGTVTQAEPFTDEYYGELLVALDWLTAGNAPSEPDTYGTPTTYTDAAVAAYKGVRNA